MSLWSHFSKMCISLRIPWAIREHHDQRHQEYDGHIPDLVLDSLQIENALQEPLYATKLLFSVHKNERRDARTNELKRTHRKIDRKRDVFHKSAKQPKWKSKSENQDKEGERDLFNDALVFTMCCLLHSRLPQTASNKAVFRNVEPYYSSDESRSQKGTPG